VVRGASALVAGAFVEFGAATRRRTLDLSRGLEVLAVGAREALTDVVRRWWTGRRAIDGGVVAES
jgi:hypothetical protein